MLTARQRCLYRRGLLAGGLAMAAAAAILGVGQGMAPGVPRGALQVALGFVALAGMDRLLRLRGPRPVPVLTYHSVAPRDLRRRWEKLGWWNLTVSPQLFEWQLGYLARRGFVTVNLKELYDHVRGEKEAPRGALVLSFDDGYLDNWVFAAPFLERRGMKATLFVSSDFVDRDGAVRPTVKEVWSGHRTLRDLDYVGYVSWAELREMEKRGVMEVQAHGTAHTWHFAGERIVDFFRNPDHYVWMFWNLCPDRRVRWQEVSRGAAVGYGRPVYVYGRSQMGRRYFEDEEMARALVARVAAGGGRAFFDRPSWRSELAGAADDYRREHPGGGRLETAEEYRERVRSDLRGNKTELEKELGHRVSFLAWPGNAFRPGLRRLALEEVGFLATTENGDFNRPGQDASWIGRVHVESSFEGTALARMDRLDFIARVNLAAGNGWYLALAAPIHLLKRFRKRELARRGWPGGDQPAAERTEQDVEAS